MLTTSCTQIIKMLTTPCTSMYLDYQDVDNFFYSGVLSFTKINSSYRDVFNFLLSSDLMYSDPTTSWLIPKSTGSNESLGSVQNWRKYMSNVKSMSFKTKINVKSQNLNPNQNKIRLTVKIKPSRRGRRWRGCTR